MAERTYKEWVEEYERLCARTPKIFDLIAQDPSAQVLRLGIDHLLSLSLCESSMHEFEHQQLQRRVERLERSLGLAPEPPPSGGAVRRVRRGKY
jgi:hypothetical protein